MEGQETRRDSGRREQRIEPIDANGCDEFGRSAEICNWKPFDFTTLSDEQREACKILLARGEVRWFLHPEQIRLVDWIDSHPSKWLVINICRQLGKSFAMVAYCIAYCIRHPRSHVFYFAPNKNQVNDIVLPHMNTVFSYLPDDLLPHKKFNTWTFPHNGSTFRINGVNVAGGVRLRGQAAHLVVIDECRDIHALKEIIDSVITPMFTTTGGRLILISTPPESPLHPFTDVYIRDAVNLKCYFTSDYHRNPLLKTDTIRQLVTINYPGGEENPTFRREYMADYSIADPEKRVVREYSELANDRYFGSWHFGEFTFNWQPPTYTVRPYTSLDPGYTDPTGMLFGYFDWKTHCLIIEDEWLRSQALTDEIGDACKVKENEVYGRLVHPLEPKRFMDIDNRMAQELWDRHQLRFGFVNKLPSDYAMINALRLAFTEGKIRVHPRCRNLRFQLKAGVWNKAMKDYLKTEKGGHLDLVAALKYLNLMCRWSELPAGGGTERTAQQQLIIPSSPFRNQGTFVSRPV